MSDCTLIYVTTPTKDQALKLGRALVENRLAACINVIDNMQSIYRWQDQIEESNEAILLIKTTRDMLEQITQEIGLFHEYSCPCIIALPIQGGNSDYLNWINKETGLQL